MMKSRVTTRTSTIAPPSTVTTMTGKWPAVRSSSALSGAGAAGVCVACCMSPHLVVICTVQGAG
jgi:hypothetical protein